MADLTERYRSNPRQHHLTESFVSFLNFKPKPPQKGGWHNEQEKTDFGFERTVNSANWQLQYQIAANDVLPKRSR